MCGGRLSHPVRIPTVIAYLYKVKDEKTGEIYLRGYEGNLLWIVRMNQQKRKPNAPDFILRAVRPKRKPTE